MWLRFGAGVITLLSLASPVLAAPVASSPQTLSIRIHDYAHVDTDTWRRAEQEVSITYASAGVQVEWRDVARPADTAAGRATWPSDPPAVITVIVLPDASRGPRGMARDVAGYAPISREHGGRIAFVFADRTRSIADRGAVAHPRVLSAVMAHEIAHLLMPQRPHSSDGLMHAHWSPDEFRRVWNQQFTPDEATTIRDTVAVLSGGGGGRLAD